MTTWLAAAPVIAVALAIVIVPGLVIAAASRMRPDTGLALAVPLSLAIIATSAILTALVGVPFSWWQPALLTVVVAAGCAAWTQRVPRPVRWGSSVARWALLGIAVSTTLIALESFAAVPEASLFSQSYDGVFHLNAAWSILQRGDGSTLNLYAVNHFDGGFEFYPAAWHDLVALISLVTGANVLVATNAAWIAAIGVAFSSGCALLALRLPLTADRRVVVVVASLVAACFPAFPILLLDWGTLYPMALGYALLPAGIALALDLIDRPRGNVARRGSLMAAWLVSVSLAHPRSLFTFGVIVGIVVLIRLAGIVRRGVRNPTTRRRTLVWTAGVIAAVVLAVSAATWYVFRHYDVASRPISDHLNGGPATAREPLWQAFVHGLFLATPLPTSGGVPAFPAILVALVTIAGAIIACRHPRLRWLTLAWLALVVLYALASGSNSDFAKLATGLWYKDRYRLLAAIPIVAVPLATIALLEAYRVMRRATGRMRGQVPHTLAPRILAPFCLAVFLVAACTGPWMTGVSSDIGRLFSLGQHKDGRLVDRDEVRLLEALPRFVPPGERVIGNPWNGSIMSGIYGDREPVFAHFTGDWGDARTRIATSLDTVGTDPAVCRAVENLRAHYVIANPHLMWNGDPTAGFFSGIDRAVASGKLIEVTRSGDTVLYRLPTCR